MRRFLAALLFSVALFAQAPRNLYQAHCAGCHGANGEGSRGPSLRAAGLQRAGDVDSLVVLLRRGIPGTDMPGFAPQTIADQPLRSLAAYVLSLRPNSAAASTPAGRGAELFRSKGKCFDCHRVNGEGNSSGPDLTEIG